MLVSESDIGNTDRYISRERSRESPGNRSSVHLLTRSSKLSSEVDEGLS